MENQQVQTDIQEKEGKTNRRGQTKERMQEIAKISSAKRKERKAEQDEIKNKLKEIERLKKEAEKDKINKEYEATVKAKKPTVIANDDASLVEEDAKAWSSTERSSESAEEEIVAVKPTPIVKKVTKVKQTRSDSESRVRKMKEDSQSYEDLYRLSNEEILKRKLYEDVKRRVMRDLFN